MRPTWTPLLLLLLLLAGCKPGAVWSPDGKRLALDPRGYLVTFDTRTKRFEQHTRGPQQVMNPVWSPDGNKIAYYRATTKGDELATLALAQFDFIGGKHSMLIPSLPRARAPMNEQQLNINILGRADLASELLSVAWRPDGQQFAYVGFAGQSTSIYVAGADGSGSRRLLPADEAAFGPVWSPDGSKIAYFTSPVVAPGTDPSAGGGAPSLAVVGADGADRRLLWDSTAKAGATAAGLGPALQWSTDGKAIILVVDVGKSQDKPTAEKSELWNVPADGGAPTRLAEIGGPSPFMTIAPGATGAALFLTPANQAEQNPRLAASLSPFAATKMLLTVDSAVLGVPAGKQPEIDRVPVPSISPDAKTIAMQVVPKKGTALLLLQSVEGGLLERLPIPLVSPAAQTTPAKKTVTPRRRTGSRRSRRR